VGASGSQSSAGGVEREEVGCVEAGEDELRLGGDAAEAGDAAAEVDGGDDRLAAGRGWHVGRTEEGYLGGEVGGLARGLRVGPGGRRRSADEAEQKQQQRDEVVAGALHEWDLSRSLPTATLGFRARWKEGSGWSGWWDCGNGEERVGFIAEAVAIGAVLRATPRQGWGWVGLGQYSDGLR
jgi:hypothetical protein